MTESRQMLGGSLMEGPIPIRAEDGGSREISDMGLDSYRYAIGVVKVNLLLKLSFPLQYCNGQYGLNFLPPWIGFYTLKKRRERGVFFRISGELYAKEGGLLEVKALQMYKVVVSYIMGV